jgi:hypothetical protein
MKRFLFWFMPVRRQVPLALLILVAVLLTQCVEPYAPAVIDAPRSLLVVDGFLNAAGVTTISLSRTYAVSSTQAPPKETGAQVFLEQEGGPRYALRETSPGTYTSEALTLNPTKNYRLSLTAANRSYASDFVPVRATPAIDQVSWQMTDLGVSVYVDSHDPTNATRYYRWETEETWEITPPLYPDYEYRDNDVRLIAVRFPYRCWPRLQSTDINVFKTTGLTQDVVSKHLVRAVSNISSQFYHKYSILVRQYAQTKEEYAYWEQLQKNSQNLGTLFDPLPTQLTGNLHCISDPDEPVLGYVGAHTVAEKRIFIDRAELPGTWQIPTGYEKCVPPDTIGVSSIHLRFADGYIVPVERLVDGLGMTIGYTAVRPDCIDCRLRGSDVKPDFWP